MCHGVLGEGLVAFDKCRSPDTPGVIEQVERNMKFKREYLRELDLPYGIAPEDGKIVSREIVDTSRWSIHYSLIFWLTGMPEGQAWMVGYSRGATECQEEPPWEYEEEVEATLVHKVEKVVTVWEPVRVAEESVQ